MHSLPAAADKAHVATNTFASAFVIMTAIIAASASSNNNNTIASTNSYVDAPPATIPATATATTTATALIASENVISTPSNFNKTTLQQQQQQQRQRHQQQQQQHEEAQLQQQLLPATQSAADTEKQQHFTANNESSSPPLDPDAGSFAVVAIDATTAKGNSNGCTANTDNTSSAAADDARNGFRDKINISNQRNEFNGRRCPQTTTTPITTASAITTEPAATNLIEPVPATGAATAKMTAAMTATASAARLKRDTSADSSFFESVELQEALSPHVQQQHEQHEHQGQEQQQQLLLLHRQKRYLLFPESSSFQMIFDLIIPIVDYTNFAIMGITCAIAWELPSKPPSEIVENFREKLNEGTFGYQRRNDSTQQHIQYVDSKDASATVAVAATPNSYYSGQPAPNSLPYTKATANTAAGLPPAASAHNTPRPQLRNYFEAVRPLLPTHYRYYSSDQSAETTLPVAVAAAGGRTKPFSKYYKNANDVSDTSGFGSADKQHFNADWQRPRPWQAHYQQSRPKPHAGGWADGADWWQRNKQRVQQNWRTKQRQWAKYDYDMPAQKGPVTSYVRPSKPPIVPAEPSPPYARNGRQRKILQAPPQHRIYPVFGKRRRRRRTANLDTFELKLEQLHLQEHLRTRQKLYGKIEKLYKLRGHNGTACVLRALCETGQRVHHQQQFPAPAHQHPEEPQSFITELLRAIFSLPSDSSADETAQQHMDAHLRRHYREAHGYGEAGRGNCAQHFGSYCAHSIWSDAKI